MDVSQTIARAFEILELLADNSSLTASDIIRQTGVHRSTVYRLLSTLSHLEYIRKEESGEYGLTAKVLRLSGGVTESADLLSLARPLLEKLSRETEETVHLSLLDRGELVYLDKWESSKALRVVMSSAVGAHAPLYCTGMGKVLLAYLEKPKQEEVIARFDFRAYTDKTLPGPEALKAELALIRERGYAFDNEEHEVGVFCLAAPLMNASGRVLAAASLSVPVARLNDEIKETLLGSLLAVSENFQDLF